ncbi:uncharacterized protein LOC105827885 [Monomorium pharaonis]|uniref:uncharacterized protein LOC105827885 n=1 Tax=Monomorium pharaonis TaxID=307658 RepID=UPI00063FC8C4|nr:uncharacterized protein LOC105827885 [Monomorium pharaonis]
MSNIKRILQVQRNRHMRDLNLAITGKSLNIEKVTIELKNSCPNLEKINLCNAHGIFTLKGIDALADCKNLQEVNFGYIILSVYGRMYYYYRDDLPKLSNSLRRLFSSCQRLEKIDLSYNYNKLKSIDLEILTLCKNLKYLNLMYANIETPNMFFEIF